MTSLSQRSENHFIVSLRSDWFILLCWKHIYCFSITHCVFVDRFRHWWTSTEEAVVIVWSDALSGVVTPSTSSFSIIWKCKLAMGTESRKIPHFLNVTRCLSLSELMGFRRSFVGWRQGVPSREVAFEHTFLTSALKPPQLATPNLFRCS